MNHIAHTPNGDRHIILSITTDCSAIMDDGHACGQPSTRGIMEINVDGEGDNGDLSGAFTCDAHADNLDRLEDTIRDKLGCDEEECC